MSKRKIDDASDENETVFVYTGKGQSVPKDLVSVQFHPSVIEVKDCRHFADCKSLKEIRGVMYS